MTARPYRLLPTASRQRGLPSIGIEMDVANEIELTPIGKGDAVVRCCERRADGKTVGELEVSVFRAALIIDRDGILEEKARDVAEQAAREARVSATVAVTLPGASGFRADVEPRGANAAALPYLYVFAMAPHDLGVDGGIAITVRSAQPDWPAAEAILRSLRIVTPFGKRQAANDETEIAPLLPVVTRSPRE